MFVILLMAGVTVHRRALVNIVHMALLACDARVLAFKFERGKVMVELCGLPCLGAVTNPALVAVRAFMGVILLMTGGAICGGGLKIRGIARRAMTLIASQYRVFSIE